MAEVPVEHPRSAQAVVPDLTGMTVGRFRIRARIGSGGMGEVYRADDTTLKRPVALKRLAPQLRADPHFRQRLLREAQRASALSDPHIALVYDVLEENDELFLVMEYVEGGNLRETQHKPIPLGEFLSMAVQCVEALVAAHGHGVVHCDIKPENIMLATSGGVKILDFGIARTLPQKEVASTTTSTADTQSSGSSSGTPAYMAPEVLLGQEPDARADIFALGVVFYEALAGKHPFLTTTYAATAERVVHEEPPPVSRLNPRVPAWLERIVARMLAKSPAERYASASELLDDLRRGEPAAGATPHLESVIPRPAPARRRFSWRLAVVAASVVLAAAVVFKKLHPPPGTGVVSEEKLLVVLPPNIIGADPATTAFGNGLVETLTAKLTQLTGRRPLVVTPLSEVRKQKISTALEARQEFSANLVMEVTIQRSGDTLSITTILVDARKLRQVWAKTVTANVSDPFATQDRVGDAALAALEIALAPDERQLYAAHGTNQPAAYDYYLQGRGYLQEFQKPENLASAITVFNRALQQDPNYALALAGLGVAYFRKYGATRDASWVKRARENCQRAVSLASAEAAGHACLGLVDDGTGNYEEAVTEYRRAVDLEPTSDDACRGLAYAYEKLGKTAEAEQTYQRAISLRPNYWRNYNLLGAFYERHARYAEAIPRFAQVVELAPDSFEGYSNLGGVYSEIGEYSKAIPQFERSLAIHPTADAYSNLATAYFALKRYADAAGNYEKALELDPQKADVWGNLGDACYWGGERAKAPPAYAKAIELGLELLRVNPHDGGETSYVATYYAMRGEKQPALNYLTRALALDSHNPSVLFNAALVYNQLGDRETSLDYLFQARTAGITSAMLRDTPNFDNLRSHPRFQALIAKP